MVSEWVSSMGVTDRDDSGVEASSSAGGGSVCIGTGVGGMLLAVMLLRMVWVLEWNEVDE